MWYNSFLFIQLIKICIVSICWLLPTMLLTAFLNKYLCGHISSLFWQSTYLYVELLGCKVTLCLTFWGLPYSFWNRLHYITFPLAMCESYHVFVFFHFGYFSECQMALLCGVAFLSLMTKVVEHIYMWLLVICLSFLMIHLSKLFAYF